MNARFDDLKAAANTTDTLSKIKLARLLNTAARMIQEQQLRIADGAVHFDLSAEFRRAAIAIDDITVADAAEKLRRAAEILELLSSPQVYRR